VPRLVALEDRTVPSTFLVKSAADDGTDSLRQAIVDANTHPGPDVIDFAIGSGPQTIMVGSTTGLELPIITDSVSIDGTSQPGYGGTPLIALDGLDAGNVHGLDFQSSGNTVRGLNIRNFGVFGGAGIVFGGNIIDGNNNVVQSCYIGTDLTGTVAQSQRQEFGILIAGSNNVIGTDGDGVNDAAEGNVISGNDYGVLMEQFHTTDHNVIAGNRIGTNADGSAAVGNALFGIFLLNNGITNTRIGTNADGVSDALERNILSGNLGGAGVIDEGQNTVIAGNYCGTDATGTLALGGGNIEVGDGASGALVGGTTATARNVISGNGYGVELFGAGTNHDTIEGNFIGTDASGTAALGNSLDGVLVEQGATDNTIGGTTAGAGNTIAFSGQAGIAITDASSTGNSIRGNSIHDNGGLGIDLVAAGGPLSGDSVTPNDYHDADTGPNALQNFPVLSSVSIAGGMTQVSGVLDSAPNSTFTLDFYANTLPDPSGHGEGQTYLGSQAVITDGNGHADFTATVAAPPAGQQFFSATATDASLNTSEFSAGTNIAPSGLSGTVFEDFNNDGQIDFGESGIPGVTVTLTGTDDFGHAVNLSRPTDAGGRYAFGSLLPGNYTLTETQPAGYRQGVDSVGTAGGNLVATDQFFVPLGQGVNGLDYNFGERPPAGAAIERGQTATIGFWHNTNGQSLILALNGGPNSTQLGDWLAATLPNLYGSNAGANDLTGKSNTMVAALFASDFQQKGQKLDAQVLATALAVYATSAALDPNNVAASYGFSVAGDGVGTATINVGSNGAAFGVANNITLTVMDLLLAANAQAVHGVLYSGDGTLRNEANDVFSTLNEVGDLL
jgi:hypothetical protein